MYKNEFGINDLNGWCAIKPNQTKPWVFHTIVLHESVSDSKSPQVFRTLLSILVDLNNVVLSISLDPPFYH